MAEEKNEDICFLYLGCTNHMTVNISMVSMIDENVKSQVTLGTYSKVSVMRKGRVSVLTNKEEKNHIKCLLCVWYEV